jgi:pimeloyl-ACP methyl ester carboxylesterase
MHYTIKGKGKAVVLLHGFIEDGSMWQAVAKELSKKYKVIVPDLPGFGNSALGKPQPKLSMAWYADAVYEMLKEAGIKKCVILGHSMGGYITLYFAEKHPEMLLGFGLINSHCFADTDDKKKNRKKGIDFIKRHGSKPFVTELYNSIFTEAYLNKNRKFVNSLITKAAKYTPEALMQANRAMMEREDKSLVLKNTKVPVLFIAGKDDQSSPLAYTLKQAAIPAIADVHIFSNSKHMCIFERKREALTAIEGFLQLID